MLSSWGGGMQGRQLEHPHPLRHMTASQREAQFKNASRAEARHLIVSHPVLGKGGSFSMLGIG